MLTGDREAVGKDVAERLGLDEYHAELLPADKVAHVERLISEKTEGKSLAFVGDGINDAPVLKRADVGIAMGALAAMQPLRQPMWCSWTISRRRYQQP